MADLDASRFALRVGERPLWLAAGAGVHFDRENAPLYTAVAEVVRPEDRVLDLGCGHGALGLVASAAGARHVTFSDVHAPSVTAALENAARNGLGPCNGVVGDWLEPLHGERFDLVLFNPPQTGGPAELEGRHPDRFGGDDGALHFVRLAAQLPLVLRRPGGRLVGMRLSRANPRAVDAALAAAGCEVRTLRSHTRVFTLESLEALAAGTGAHQLALRAAGRAAFTGPDADGRCTLVQELFCARWQA